ncbi:CBS domain-containing protein [Bacteroidota bacterium]
MIKVKDVLQQKGDDFYSVRSNDSINDALNLLEHKDVGALMVIDEEKIIGMFSERDYTRKSKKNCGECSKVSDFMSTQIIVVNPDTTINECMALITQKRVRHLPVLDKNEIKGLVSIGDIVNAIIKEQDVTIKDLENYIIGSYGA